MHNFAQFVCIAIVALATVSCHSSSSKPTLFTTWHARKLELQTSSPAFPEAPLIEAKNYGSAALELQPDSIYKLNIEVLKDVTLKRKILGAEATTTLIPAIYKTFRTGHLSATDSTLILFDENHSIFAQATFKLWEGEMTATFEDEQHRHWWSSWRTE
jgi:hypothetical protein